jgi:uncharacterized protein YjbK
MTHTEMEIKLDLLNEKNYRKLLGFFEGKTVSRDFENHFLDSSDGILSKAGWALRIRCKADKAIITAKSQPEGETTELTVRKETEEQLPLETAVKLLQKEIEIDDLPGQIAGTLGSFCQGKKLSEMISFTTRRTTAELTVDDDRLNLEIDRTRFADGSADYELEVELPRKELLAPVVKKLSEIFEPLGIPLTFQPESKLARALQRSGNSL